MILYFTGTGNSRHVANVIAETTGDEIVSIGTRMKANDYSSITSQDPLVFVGPVYAGRFPRVMEEYIQKTTFKGTKKAYFIATCAQTPWVTIEYVEKLCKKKGFSLLGFNSVVMPQGWVAGGGTQPKEMNEKVLSEAEPKIQTIAETIRNGEKLPDEQPGKAIMSKLLNPIMYATMVNAKGFAVTDKCNGCGKCAELCPLNNVSIKNGIPTWGKNCTQCSACIAGCPCEAIEYGKKTIGKPRYYLENKQKIYTQTKNRLNTFKVCSLFSLYRDRFQFNAEMYGNALRILDCYLYLIILKIHNTTFVIPIPRSSWTR